MSPFEIVIGVVGVLSACTGAFYAYKRSKRIDENVQVYAGYQQLIERYEKDDQARRLEIANLRERLIIAEQRLEDAENRITLLLNRLEKNGK